MAMRYALWRYTRGLFLPPHFARFPLLELLPPPAEMFGRRVGRVGVAYGPRWLARASLGQARAPRSCLGPLTVAAVGAGRPLAVCGEGWHRRSCLCRDVRVRVHVCWCVCACVRGRGPSVGSGPPFASSARAPLPAPPRPSRLNQNSGVREVARARLGHVAEFDGRGGVRRLANSQYRVRRRPAGGGCARGRCGLACHCALVIGPDHSFLTPRKGVSFFRFYTERRFPNVQLCITEAKSTARRHLEAHTRGTRGAPPPPRRQPISDAPRPPRSKWHLLDVRAMKSRTSSSTATVSRSPVSHTARAGASSPPFPPPSS